MLNKSFLRQLQSDFASRDNLRQLAALRGPLMSADERRARRLQELCGNIEDQRDADFFADELPFEWMFAFPLPEAIEPKTQSGFEARCRSNNLKNSLETLLKAFPDSDKEKLKDVLQGDFNFNDESWNELSRRKSGFAVGRLLSMSSMSFAAGSRTEEEDYEEPPDSFRRGVQCSIELMLAFFDSLNVAIAREMRENESRMGRKLFGRVTNTGEVRTPLRFLKFLSLNKDMLYVCVRLDRASAELLADVLDYPVQLAHRGLPQIGVEVSDPRHKPAYVHFNSMWRKVCEKYEDPFDKGKYTVLKQIDRIRLFYDKLTKHVDIILLRGVGLLADHFPMHHRESLMSLRRDWGSLWLIFQCSQPLDDIRDYFGEEIAFYFVFLHELIQATICLSVPAVAFLIVKAAWDNHANLVTGAESWTRATIALSLFLTLWFRIFTKRWQWTSHYVCVAWGIDMQGSTLRQLPNFRFVGKPMPSPYNERELTAQVSKTSRRCGLALSFLLSGAFVVIMMLVNMVELWIYWLLRQKLHDSMQKVAASCVMGCLTGTQIKVVDKIWDNWSDRITDLEKAELEVEFYWSKAAKTAIVRFINTTSQVFFQALLPGLMCRDKEGDENFMLDCLDEYRFGLDAKVLSLFVTRFLLLGVFENVIKSARQLMSATDTDTQDANKAPFTELQTKMPRYSPSNLSSDYLDAVIPLSFVVFFGMMAPSSIPLLGLVFLIETRTCAWKLCHVYRRPYPRLADGIGIFDSILNLLGQLMTMTHLGLAIMDFGGAKRMFKLLGFHFILDNPNLKFLWDQPTWFTNLFFYLLFTLILLFLWNAVDLFAPGRSHLTTVEVRRHNLQRSLLAQCNNSVLTGPLTLSRDERVDFNDNLVMDSRTSTVRKPSSYRPSPTPSLFGSITKGNSGPPPDPDEDECNNA
eukprot:TRINITY_DN80506_c0_g1_i1.p1 TRINITY_DN80506_c0_g1~~TRINITY_DN80506_c0_g1_i1.p1  ORF type:complete len:917 (+),score=189.65 TRINITY_DN80506_c0_g1_i1:187-2937(+)